jgi:hypothetical protein
VTFGRETSSPAPPPDITAPVTPRDIRSIRAAGSRSSVGPKHRSLARRGGAGAKQRTAGAAVGRLQAGAGNVHLPRSGSGRDYLSDCEELHNPYSSRALAWRPPSPSGSIRAHAAAFVTAHGSLDLFAQPPSTTVPPQPAARRIRIRSTTPTSATATLPRRALGAAPPSHPPPSTHPPPSAHHGRSWPAQPAHHQCVLDAASRRRLR